MAQQEPTISSILQELAQEYDQVVNEREVLDRVLERRPSQAKDPYASIREKLRWDGAQLGWVRLGGGELLPLRIALQDLVFRVIPEPEEIRENAITRLHLVPFVSGYNTLIQIEDATGKPVEIRQPKATEDPGFIPIGAQLPTGNWFRQSGFEPGDSILVTIAATTPLTLRLEREPQNQFRADDVLRQERELLDSVAAHVGRSRSNMLMPEECILPIYARASWRTEYPGRPWQQLVANDRRLRLLDGMFIADSSFRRPLDLFFPDEQQEQRREEEEQALLADIAAFQDQLLASRRDDAKQGLWDGKAPRSSTARVIFDTQTGTSTIVYLEPVDALSDHRQAIDENLAQGGYDSEDWGRGFDDGDDDEYEEDEFGEDEDFFGLSQIDDIQAFMEQNPGLAEAAQKLMAALTPDEIERLQNAETPDDAQKILANRFQRLMHVDPSLFATLAPYTPDEEELNGNGHGYTNGNGNGHSNGNGAHILLDNEEDWEEELEDEDWEEVDADLLGSDTSASIEALGRSNDLMDRFYQHLLAQGKSESTATSRTGDLWVYADFLANYYNRGLAEGDYATLDECLFFYYPRKVINSSSRAAREMCTSIKQFYAFLRNDGLADDGFAQAIWRRRDQAARVVELYEHIDSDSPQFERLFAYLFAPYTV